MSIRWKLLVLLLAIALIPLITVAALDRGSMLRLGYDLSAMAHSALVKRTVGHLEQRIRDQAVIMQRRRQGLEYTLRAQARKVEEHLAAPAPAKVAVRMAEDYDRGVNLPADMGPSTKHYRFVKDRPGIPIAVTYSDQVFKLAPGVSTNRVAVDMARLASMPAEYRFLYNEYADLIYWQTTGLESGILTSFPGHGGYPEDYNHRPREWYIAAKQQDRLTWIGPYLDASSEQLILTLSMPVHWPDGSFAGATALDVSVSDLVKAMEMPDIYSTEARSILVILEWTPEASAHRPRIIARPGFHRRGERWDTPFDREWLDPDESDEASQFVLDMAERRSGTRRMPYLGRDSLWVYGPVASEGEYLVFIVPYEEVLAQAAVAERSVLDRVRAALRTTGIVAVAAAIGAAIIALSSSRSVAKPIAELAQAAERVGRGEFETRVRIETGDELEQLGNAFNAMVPQLEDQMLMKHSLALAMEVQRHLLPGRAPQIEGLDVAGRSIYCDETGGDYYDFLDFAEPEPGQLGVVIGDVTGHGIAAAMLMTSGRAILRFRAGDLGGLADLMGDLNRHLASEMSGGRFMTLFFLLIDARARQARWVSAGHDPAIVFDPESNVFSELAGVDMAMGIDPGWQFREQGPVDLRPGQIMLLGTDGIWEARNPRGEFFGKEAVREVMRHHADSSAEHICEAIVDAVDTFREKRIQEDDLTLVIAKVTPNRDAG